MNWFNIEKVQPQTLVAPLWCFFFFFTARLNASYVLPIHSKQWKWTVKEKKQIYNVTSTCFFYFAFSPLLLLNQWIFFFHFLSSFGSSSTIELSYGRPPTLIRGLHSVNTGQLKQRGEKRNFLSLLFRACCHEFSPIFFQHNFQGACNNSFKC